MNWNFLNEFYNIIRQEDKIDKLKNDNLLLTSNLLHTNSLVKKIEVKLKELTDLMELKENLRELEYYWNNKYNTSMIVYKGRSLPFSTEKCNIPINLLITPNDPFIIKDLGKWNLMADETTDWEKQIPLIYEQIKKEYYKYEFDKNVWGNNEVWEFPFELRVKGFTQGFDCDSWSHFQTSYYIAAGISRWRIRVVCGETKLGGHSTVYVYSLKDNNWHHLNSTYGKPFIKNISDFPTHKDAEEGNDPIGINKVWFSFNDHFCWYKFEGDIPKELQIK